MPRRWLFMILVAASTTATGVEAPPVLPNSELERRVLAVVEELRCLVCQSQTIADFVLDKPTAAEQHARSSMPIASSANNQATRESK